jgi:hypothetical protein
MGKLENNNPMLVLSVPIKLRNNTQLMTNLRRNSRRLLTHFDLYTTLYDIAAVVGVENNWLTYPYRNFSGLMSSNRGESLLRPMQLVRNCDSLEIPQMYCNCREQREHKSINATLVKIIVNHFIRYLNRQLIHVKHICQPIRLEGIVDAIRIVSANRQITYAIAFVTQPNAAEFEGRALVQEASTISAISDNWLKITEISRSNSFGKQSDCLKRNYAELRPICQCRRRT